MPEFARSQRIEQNLLIECEDDSSMHLTLADPGNSVSVRDKDNQVEYLGQSYPRSDFSDHFLRLLIVSQTKKARRSHFAIASPLVERDLGARPIARVHWLLALLQTDRYR